MLSKDDLGDGINFILKLSDATGTPAQWTERFYGDIASRWYDIYCRSDWEALRAHGAEVFHNRVTEAEAERVRKSAHCIVIHTLEVKAEQIDPHPRLPEPIQPRQENEGGSLTQIVLRN
jgi:hypothetical protein